MDREPLLRMSGMDKSFAGVPALHDVHMSVAPGEVRALIGQNGAGKSTLIKVLTGVYRRDAGRGRVRREAGRLHLDPGRPAARAGHHLPGGQPRPVPVGGRERLHRPGPPPVRPDRLEGGQRRGAGAARRARRARRRHAPAARVPDRHPADDRDRPGPLVRRQVGDHGRADVVAGGARGGDPAGRDPPAARRGRRDRVRLPPARRAVRGVRHDHGAARRPHRGRLADLRAVPLRPGLDHARPRADRVRATGPARRRGARRPRRPTVLEARDLRRAPVLNGSTVALRRGEVVGLAGLLGSGRSETARALFGADPVTDGEIHRDGEPVRFASPQEAIRARDRVQLRGPQGRGHHPRPVRPGEHHAGPAAAPGPPRHRRPRPPAGDRRPVHPAAGHQAGRARTRRSASCPGATSRRCCWPAGCAPIPRC